MYGPPLFRMAAVAIVTTLMACNDQANDRKHSELQLPDNAIQVDGDLYMIPIRKPAGPCTPYRTASKTGAAIAAIHYRKTDGTFVTDKLLAGCRE